MEKTFIRFANRTAKLAGTPWTFLACLLIVVVWALSGPMFGFNETWQLVINTGTTIVTFLMVFLIQNTQNRDAAAMHAKLDELVYAVKKADARFIGIEHLTEAELEAILVEVEKRATAVHAGKPAGAVAGKRAMRAEESGKGRPARARPKSKA